MAVRAAGFLAFEDQPPAGRGLAEDLVAGVAGLQRFEVGDQCIHVVIGRLFAQHGVPHRLPDSGMQVVGPAVPEPGPGVRHPSEAEHGFGVSGATVVAGVDFDGLGPAFVMATVATVPLVERSSRVVEDGFSAAGQ